MLTLFNQKNNVFITLFLICIFLVISCRNDDNILDSETEKLVQQATAELSEELENLNSFDQKLKNSIFLEVELPEQSKVAEELLKENVDIENLDDLIDRKFIKSNFRYDLFKVIGHSAKPIVNSNPVKVYEVEIFNYMIDSVKPEIIYPGEAGLLEEIKITKNMTASLSFFIGSGSLENNEIYHGTISETAAVIIDENEIDLDKIKKTFPTEESRSNVELITSITVTEFLHKKYKKREKKIKVKEFPVIKSGVSLGTGFYTENSSLKKKYKISINTTSIQDIISRIQNKGKTGSESI